MEAWVLYYKGDKNMHNFKYVTKKEISMGRPDIKSDFESKLRTGSITGSVTQKMKR